MTVKRRDPERNRDSSDRGSCGGDQEIVKEFVDSSTTHGLPRVLNSSRTTRARLFWCLVTLCFFVICVFQGTQLVIQFFRRDTATKTTLKRRSTLPFPAVTICNLNMMRSSKLNGTRFQGLAELDRVYDADLYYPLIAQDALPDFNFSLYGLEMLNTSFLVPENVTSLPLQSTDLPTDLPNFAEESVGSSPSQEELLDRTSASPLSSLPPAPPSSSLPEPSDSFSQSFLSSFSFPSFFVGDGRWGESLITNSEDGDANDWERLYNKSINSDFTDLQSIVKPTRDELRDLGHQPEDFILQCSFDSQPCDYRNFSVIQNIRYGNCFVFNDANKLSKKKPLKTARTGHQYGILIEFFLHGLCFTLMAHKPDYVGVLIAEAGKGLHLTLLVDQPEYVGVLSPEAGVKVSVNDPNIFPFPEDDGTMASTGKVTAIGIRKHSIKRLGDPFEYCVPPDTDSPYEGDKYTYSRRSCSKMCLQSTLASDCQCVTDVLINMTMCSPLDETQRSCQKRVMAKYIRGLLDCSNECHNPCEENNYKPTISAASWPAQKYEEHLKKRLIEVSQKAKEILEKPSYSWGNLVRVKIFYEDLNYEIMEENPLVTVESLFGGVGGLMGLYIGMSFVSVIELLVFIVELIRSSFLRTKQ